MDSDRRTGDDRSGIAAAAPERPAAPDRDSRPTRPITSRKRRRFSRLTLSILALNLFPLATLFGGLMYVGSYERSLLEAERVSLQVQTRLIADALGEIAVPPGRPEEQEINSAAARLALRRMVRPAAGVRARLFDRNGELILDSRTLLGPGGDIRVEALPPPSGPNRFATALIRYYDWFFYLLARPRDETPIYSEKASETAKDFTEVQRALLGDQGGVVRRAEQGYLIISHAVPVQRFKRVFGALMLTTSSIDIDKSVRRVRFDIVQIFAVVFVFTVMLSLYLARAIARPINRLAAAADGMRRGHGRQVVIPDFSERRDEIGDLADALRDLTNELWDRMDAIERFAADVSHELKNPLSSLRSAVETAGKVTNPEQQLRLLQVIQEDVDRLDRLITDISRASRVDAEMSRVLPQPIQVGDVLEAMVEIGRTTGTPGRARVSLDLRDRPQLWTRGIEDRLVQVFQNILANAISFSPKNGRITVTAAVDQDVLRIVFEDEGPGIPDGKLEEIFKRFYTERPTGEKFGTHSGLGLSISRQIIEAMGGTLHAENRTGEDGTVAGARFVVRIPKAPKG